MDKRCAVENLLLLLLLLLLKHLHTRELDIVEIVPGYLGFGSSTCCSGVHGVDVLLLHPVLVLLRDGGFKASIKRGSPGKRTTGSSGSARVARRWRGKVARDGWKGVG